MKSPNQMYRFDEEEEPLREQLSLNEVFERRVIQPCPENPRQPSPFDPYQTGAERSPTCYVAPNYEMFYHSFVEILKKISLDSFYPIYISYMGRTHFELTCNEGNCLRSSRDVPFDFGICSEMIPLHLIEFDSDSDSDDVFKFCNPNAPDLEFNAEDYEEIHRRDPYGPSKIQITITTTPEDNTFMFFAEHAYKTPPIRNIVGEIRKRLCEKFIEKPVVGGIQPWSSLRSFPPI